MGLKLFKNLKKIGRVAEWSALQTRKRGDSGSIPAKVKTFLWSNQDSRIIRGYSFWIRF